MSRSTLTFHAPVGGCGCIILIVFLNLLFGGVSTQYAVDHWATLFVHHPVHVPLLPCFIAGIFIGSVSIPVALLTWLLVLAGVLA